MGEYWDAQASIFDQEPDHGLQDPSVHAAWRELLVPEMPAPPARVLDVGCGTGSIAALLAGAGFEVSGIDLSAQMIAAASAKTARLGLEVDFLQADAANPPYDPGSFEVVFARHVLWSLPDPSGALASWLRLLRPDGRLVLVEGNWATGVGIPSESCRDLVLEHRNDATIRTLDDTALWGRTITDDRYLLTSRH